MKKTKRFLTFLVLALFCTTMMTGCLADTNTLEDIPDSKGETAGIFSGLWHGVISPVTMIVSFFTDKIHFYDANNTGELYDIGYFVGTIISTFVLHKIFGSKK